ncbi:hypothetical protein E3N88_28607 [Mikania micrantha]|uniref:Uncharacterized protein n=1 Tax=Mikania micrantha TaxID=192012 RepID=A0A5N6N0Y1_9ASTR|nr:hypothetical protein E3N88_28607 [Mikania micrantha]
MHGVNESVNKVVKDNDDLVDENELDEPIFMNGGHPLGGKQGRRDKEQMKNYKAVENENTTIDPFLVVMNKENYGYHRLYGGCATNTLIKKVEGPSTSYMIAEGLMESFKANVDVDKNQLLEIRKEIEDDHERKKAELQAMREDIDSQRQSLEAMMRKVIRQLPVGDQED